MNEQIKVIWIRPYQIAEGGAIIPQMVRCSSTVLLEKFEEASRLMEILQTDVRDFKKEEQK